jgi:hypothetical protein
LGLAASARASTAEANIATVITRVRPSASDSAVSGITATASAPVPIDTVRLAVAGESRNVAASSGSTA